MVAKAISNWQGDCNPAKIKVTYKHGNQRYLQLATEF